MSRSVPSSPGDRKQGSIPVVGSAEDLVGRVNIFLQLFFREINFTRFFVKLISRKILYLVVMGRVITRNLGFLTYGFWLGNSLGLVVVLISGSASHH